MKIKYKNGDLFNCEETVIAHGCNCQGVMGSGVAKLIRNRFPKAYKDYMAANKILGSCIISDCNSKVIINCLTQEFYGRDNKQYVSYDAIMSCFKRINSLGYHAVAIPKIGAGLGGGDWKVIEKIIEEETTNTQIVVYEI